VLSLPASLLAQEWNVLGAKHMGMGGAGVASARGGFATYWNPAALARSQGIPGTSGAGEQAGRLFDVEGGVSAFFAAPGDAIKRYDEYRVDVRDLDLETLGAKLESGAPLTEEESRSLLRIVGRDIPALDQPGEGYVLEGIAGPTARVWRIGISALSTVHGGARNQVDLENVALGVGGMDAVVGSGQDRSGSLSPSGQSLADALAMTGSLSQNQAEEFVYQAEAGGVDTTSAASQDALLAAAEATASGDPSRSILGNQSGPVVRGLFIEEIGLGYGQPLGDLLAIGATAKGMMGLGYEKGYTFTRLPRVGDVANDLLDFDENDASFDFGLDVGALFTPTDWAAVGITGKNLNRPSFDRLDGGHFVIDPSTRAGVALYPVRWLTLAADLDLYKIHSRFLPGYDSQVLGGGAELDLGIIALRLGLSKNLAESDEELLLHGGFALQIWRLNLEVAVACTPSFQGIEVDDEDTEIPERCGASVTLGANINF
jgi:hypothetical protein